MPSNLERYQADLEKLISRGTQLHWAMQREVIGAAKFDAQVNDQLKDKAKTFISNLPEFKSAYQAWYSEAKVLLKQVLPDRMEDFVRLHEKPKGRKDISYGNYFMEDYLQGLRVTHSYGDVKVDVSAALPQFEQMVNIIKAIKARFDSSLFDIRQLVQADLFDREIDAARHLSKQKFHRAAGAIAGVVLEEHLQQVCIDHNIKILKKNPTLGDLNELLKSNNVIDVPQWRFISMLADIRNICDHNKSKEPTEQQVIDLVDGSSKVLKTVF